MPPLGAILVFLFFRGLWRSKSYSLIGAVLLFVLVHLVIGHKENRFLFPLLYLTPVLCFLGMNFELKTNVYSLFLRVLVFINCLALVGLTVLPAKSEISLYRSIYNRLKSNSQSEFVYSHVDDDPLMYAGLRPYFYLPFKFEAHRLEKLEDFNQGFLIVSKSDLNDPAMDGILNHSNCERLWSDSLFPFRGIPIVSRILKLTKYRYQLLFQCE